MGKSDSSREKNRYLYDQIKMLLGKKKELTMKNNNEKKEKGTFSDILKKASDFGVKTVDLGKKAADGIHNGQKQYLKKQKRIAIGRD